MSIEANRRLVNDKVLAEGECEDPGDLAKLATLVFAKTGNQTELVVRLPIDQFKMAKPNTGHRLLVALMAERAVSHVLSVNFDLAVQNASSALGAPIHVVDAAGQAIPATPTLVHLHGNANGGSESLVLRREVIDDAWKMSWQQVVANQILAAPNVLFVGLGSAAPVLSDTVGMIAEARQGKTFFQADLVAHGASSFATQLGIPPDRYIRGGWCAVMARLADRLVKEQVHSLTATGIAILRGNGVSEEEIADFSNLAAQLEQVSLLALGSAPSARPA
jgi:hypothetical protein